jgi:hypothetical protein
VRISTKRFRVEEDDSKLNCSKQYSTHFKLYVFFHKLAIIHTNKRIYIYRDILNLEDIQFHCFVFSFSLTLCLLSIFKISMKKRRVHKIYHASVQYK